MTTALFSPKSLKAGVCDALHAHDPQAVDVHVQQVPVLAGPDVHHPASVVWLLKHQPVSIHDVAGHAVGHAETVHDVLTVLHQLVHLAREVLPLVDPQPEGSPLLEEEYNMLPRVSRVLDGGRD